MRLARIHPNDLKNTQIFERVRDIVSYFKGKEDKSYWITRLISGKPGINTVDHLWSYVAVSGQRDKVKQSLDESSKSLDEYSRKILDLVSQGTETDHALIQSFRLTRENHLKNQSEFNRLEQEVGLYEK